MPVSQELLDILVCPACKASLDNLVDTLVCVQCGRRYPVRDDIPIMLIEEGDKGKAEREKAAGGR